MGKAIAFPILTLRILEERSLLIQRGTPSDTKQPVADIAHTWVRIENLITSRGDKQVKVLAV
ncbi:MAG: hypothetical protein HWQ35_34510 [Nostoc sp. NMS1]|uniref:hypothetical protein n=1 Tax=uncultured Nostoc sp. TaxID=340711 RepID=UPI0035CC63D1|nr:hypothetical protein [Nostoc sp. NMS1]